MKHNTALSIVILIFLVFIVFAILTVTFLYFKNKTQVAKRKAPILIRTEFNIDAVKKVVNISGFYTNYSNKTRQLKTVLSISDILNDKTYFRAINPHFNELLLIINNGNPNQSKIDNLLAIMDSQYVDLYFKTNIGKTFWFSIYLNEYNKAKKQVIGISNTTLYPNDKQHEIFDNSLVEVMNNETFDIPKLISNVVKKYKYPSYTITKITLDFQTRIYSVESTGLYQLLTSFGVHVKQLGFDSFISNYATLTISQSTKNKMDNRSLKNNSEKIKKLFYAFAEKHKVPGDNFIKICEASSNLKTLKGVEEAWYQTYLETYYNKNTNLLEEKSYKSYFDLLVKQQQKISKKIKSNKLRVIEERVWTEEEDKLKTVSLDVPHYVEKTILKFSPLVRRDVFNYLINNAIIIAKKNPSFEHVVFTNVTHIPEMLELNQLPKNLTLALDSSYHTRGLFYDLVKLLVKVKHKKLIKNIGTAINKDSLINESILKLLPINKIYFTREFNNSIKSNKNIEIKKWIIIFNRKNKDAYSKEKTRFYNII